MEIVGTYIIKVIIIQTAMFAIFWLFNRKNADHQFSRFYLLSSLLLPFLIPIIEIPIHLTGNEIMPSGFTSALMIPEYAMEQNPIPVPEISETKINWWIPSMLVSYVLIAFIFIYKLIQGYLQIRKLAVQSHHSILSPRGYLIHYITSDILSFSFLKKIYLSDQFSLSTKEKKTIIAHEELHIAQGHSWDLIICQISSAVLWLNPVIYLIQKHLKEVHEYLADAHVCKETNTKDYTALLQSYRVRDFKLAFGNSISGSSINKRINMMKTSTQSPTLFRSSITVFLAILTFLAVACRDNLETPIVAEESFQFEFTDEDLELEIERMMTVSKRAPTEVLEMYENLQRKNPQYHYSVLVQPVIDKFDNNLTLDEIREKWRSIRALEHDIEYLRFLNQEEFDKSFTEKIYYSGDLTIINAYVMIRKVDRLKEAKFQYKMSGDDEIHDDFDKEASFKGGERAFKQYLKQHMTYPDIALKNKIEDKVGFRFVVTKTGQLMYLNINERPSIKDKDIKLEFEKAAFHALKSTEGMWHPAEKDGKYVLSRMTLDVEFKLEE